LLVHYRQCEDPKCYDVAARGMRHLCQTREAGDVPPDHWALLATEPLIDISPENVVSEEREAFLNHARHICELMLGTQVLESADPGLVGSFTADGRTCPTAIRLEGLLAPYRFLPKTDADLRRRIASACHAGTAFLIRAQIGEGRLRGGIPRAVCSKPDIPGNRSFNSRVGEIRIDYVQHALSALIAYRRTLSGVLGDGRLAPASAPTGDPGSHNRQME